MKIHRITTVLIVLLTTTSLAVGAAAATADRGGAVDAQSTVTLTVTVTDDFNNGISGATVTASWDGGEATEETKSNGQALVDVEQGVDVELHVDHRAYTLNNPAVVEDADGQDVAIEVFRKATAEVTVVDDGAPLENARVVLQKENQDRAAAEGRTDGDGRFTSDTIEKGTYTVAAVKEGYYWNETTVEMADTSEATVALEEGTVNVDVLVEDDHFDEPRAVEGAQIAFEGPTSVTVPTRGNGKATAGLYANARYAVTVTSEDYSSVTRDVAVGEDPKSVTFAIDKEDALTLEAVNQRVVVGENVQLSVTDEYGEPVEGAEVLVDGETAGETNADGVYRAAIDSGGDHTITVEQDGVTSNAVAVEGVSGDGEPAPDGTSTVAGTTESVPDLPDLGQPDVLVKVGVAAVGVLLAFLIVRRLL